MTQGSDEGGKTERPGELPAREHSQYAEDGHEPDAKPREKDDDQDPIKRETGRGNASKGPWKEQGGAGHGENYGGVKDDAP